ncbi:MAG: CDP-alcohol phosphatidyltransferase family protein [Magnetovibrio sp.]|nr:CDP-alcohol phosphatidyltransferase family protein [Magnetovibrio sp.]
MSHHTWLHRISRTVIVQPLRRTPVTPNHLTAMRLATGLGAAAMLAVGEGTHDHWAAGLFVISILFDRADGDLARLSGKTSEAGHAFDLISDALCNALIFIGLGVGLSASNPNGWMLPMGLVAGLSVVWVLVMVVQAESRAGRRAGEIPGAAGFDADDAMLAVPVAIWFGAGEQLLYAAAIGAPAFAIFFFFFMRAKVRRSVL